MVSDIIRSEAGLCHVTMAFNVFMDKIEREGMENFVGGVKMSTTEVSIVLFADDVMLLTEREEDMETNLRELKKAMSNWGMKIHWGKTKVMVVSRQEEGCKVCVDGEEIEHVQNMKYLGAILSAGGTCEEEIEHRVGAAARVIYRSNEEGGTRKEGIEESHKDEGVQCDGDTNHAVWQ